MITLTLDALQDHLQKAKFPVNLQGETRQLYMLYKIDEKEFPLFMRVSRLLPGLLPVAV